MAAKHAARATRRTPSPSRPLVGRHAALALLAAAALICCTQPVYGSRDLRGWFVATPTSTPTPTPQQQLVASATLAPQVGVTTPSPRASPRPSPVVPSPRPSPAASPRIPSPVPSPRIPSPVPSPRASPVMNTLVAQTTLPTFSDVFYDDDYIHFGMLIRVSDWLDNAWGVQTMAAGTRLMYDKTIDLPYTSWRLVRDPMDSTKGPDGTILMSTSVLHVVSRDGRLVWSCNGNGYVTLVDYATALQGDLSRIRARISDKHGLAYQIGKPLVRGYHWVKMKFDAAGGTDVTPSDLGLAWQGKSDASYIANRKAWEYGFEVQDVDFTDPTILRKKK